MRCSTQCVSYRHILYWPLGRVIYRPSPRIRTLNDNYYPSVPGAITLEVSDVIIIIIIIIIISQPDYSGRMGNVQMGSHWSLGRAASRYVGTSRSLAHWPSHTSTEHLTRQVQQQSWQPLAKRTNMLISAPVISLSPLPLRHWEFLTHQLASF